MRRLILLLLCASALAVAAQPSPSDRAAQYLAEVQSKTASPAVAVTVARGGAIVFSRAVGSTDLENRVAATTESVFGIGSVSKVMTGVAVMQLVEAGKVRLDDDVRKYVPAFPDKGHVITIENILTHTSGIRHYLRKDSAATSPASSPRKSSNRSARACGSCRVRLLAAPGPAKSRPLHINRCAGRGRRGSGRR